MATDKQLAANRENAQFSTGPRTEEGKARSARNSLRDGFYSKALIIMPGMETEFQLLREQLLDSYKPSGGVEDALFDEILLASWNLRRAAVSEARMYAPQSDPAVDPLDDDKNDVKLRRLRQFARHNQTSRDKAIKLLSDVQTEVRARLQAFPPDETAEAPIMDQKPQSLSVLCRLPDVVKAMKNARGYKSAPLSGKTASVKNEADSVMQTALKLGALVQAKAADASDSKPSEVKN
ncbi:MAG: hypothetical protein HY820_36015 [Acidobacteria bacterium]|nr:hypothetical protein [Acidobacteriota bacterium]